MSVEKLTQGDAQRILQMIKHSLINEINFPLRGSTQEFNVIGDTKADIFTINIYRAKIRPFKYSMGARIKKQGIMLLELHINPTTTHRNPDGEKIIGSHWHIYKEGFGITFAFPAEDIQEDKFVDNTIAFLEKFNVVECPKILHQLEIV